MNSIIRRNNDLINFGDRFFDSFFQNSPSIKQFDVDIVENENGYELKADLPGFKKEDLNLTYSDNVLTIEAVSNSENEEKDESKNYIRRERSYSSFRRQFIVKNLDRDQIKAKFENGVLTLDLPRKAKEEKEVNKIAID